MRTNEQTYLHKIGFNDEDRNSDIHDKICMRLCDPEVSKKMMDLIIDKIKEYPHSYIKRYQESGYSTHFAVIREIIESYDREIELSLIYKDLIVQEEFKIGDKVITPFGEYERELITDKKFKLNVKQNNLKSSYKLTDTKVSHHLNNRHVYFDVVYEINGCHDWDIYRSIEITEDEIRKLTDKSKEKFNNIIGNDKGYLEANLKIVIEVKAKRENVTKSIQQMDTYRNLCEGIAGYGNRPYNVWPHDTAFILATMYDLDAMEQMVLKQNNIVWVYLKKLSNQQQQLS